MAFDGCEVAAGYAWLFNNKNPFMFIRHRYIDKDCARWGVAMLLSI